MTELHTFRSRLTFGLGLLALILPLACHRKGNPASKFETTPVERGPVVAKVTATGTLSALVTVQVGSQVSGRLQRIVVDYNTVVHKGELLAQLDPELFKAAMEQAKANLAQARAAVKKADVVAAKAKLDLGREKMLREKNLVAQADLDAAQETYDAALADIDNQSAQVMQTEAQLHQALVNLKYTSIYSPIDGVVISRSVDVGQTVAASLQAPTLFTIAEDLRKMQVDTSVSEADIGKLTPGQAASFTVDAYPGEHFDGKIRQIRNAATNVQNVVTYDVVIDVMNPDLKLRPGMTANVEMVSDQRQDVLRVATTAFRFRPPPELMPQKPDRHRSHGENAGLQATARHEERKPLWVLRDGQPKMTMVKAGITDGKVTEIVSGDLQEGDAIITAYNGGSEKKPGGPGSGGMPRRMF